MSSIPNIVPIMDIPDALPTHRAIWRAPTRQGQFVQPDASNFQFTYRTIRLVMSEGSKSDSNIFKLDSSIISPARRAEPDALEYAEGLFSREFPVLSDLSDEEIEKAIRKVRKDED